MFDEREIQALDREYFNVITADDRDVTIQSRNTGHYWYLHCTEYPNEESCVIFHKHKFSHPYHQHGRSGCLRSAVRQIKKHDTWQMGGRK